MKLLWAAAACVIGLVAIVYQERSLGDGYIVAQPRHPGTRPVASTISNDALGSSVSSAGAEQGQDLTAIRTELRQAGWAADAADTVVDLNSDWFGILAEENRAALNRQIAQLKSLGRQKRVMRFLVKHPETAGLLAGVPDPAPIVESLEESAENYSLLTSLYTLHATPDDAMQLARALQADRDWICRMLQRGVFGGEILFIFDRSDEPAKEYDRWLREAVDGALAGNNERLASMVNLLLRHGPEIRKRFVGSEDFRHRFRTEIWPGLTEVAGNGDAVFEKYMDDPRIWDLLSLPEGKQLLQRCGPLPLDLLYGYPELGRRAYPVELHEAVVQALLIGDEDTVSALMRFRNEPLFYDLLRRPLPPAVLAAAINHLFGEGTNYHEHLVRYHVLSDSALAEEVGPPPSGWQTWIPFYYTLYEVPRKIWQGRDPTFMDWLQGIADPVSIVLPIAKGGEIVAKGTGKAGSKVISQALKKEAINLAEHQLGKEVAGKLSEEGLMKFAAIAAIRDLPSTVGKALGQAGTVDITNLIRCMFNYSGVGRDTFKSLTGLEARVFMRGDAKVAVHIGNLAMGVLTTRFMRETANNFALGAAAESGVGTDTIRQVFRVVHYTKEQLDNWRKNISAWWLMNASGMPNLVPSTMPGEVLR